jgi:hypothetical protein
MAAFGTCATFLTGAESSATWAIPDSRTEAGGLINLGIWNVITKITELIPQDRSTDQDDALAE